MASVSELAAIQARIQAARAEGQPATEAELRAHLARHHSSQGQWRDAAQELHWAAELAAQAGDPAAQAEYLFGKGSALISAPGMEQAAARALRRASAAAKVGGRPAIALEASRQLLKLYAAAQRWDEAAEAAARIVEQLDWNGSRPELLAGLEQQAFYLHRLDQAAPHERHKAAALKALDTAITTAEAIGDLRRAIELRVLRRAMRDFSWEEGAPLSALNEELDADLQGSPFSEELLGQAMDALRAGMSDTGTKRALNARDAAEQAGDPLRYLIAGLLVAEGRELAADPNAAIHALLECRATLERFQNPVALRAVRLVLEAQRSRWGEAAMEEALAAWTQRR